MKVFASVEIPPLKILNTIGDALSGKIHLPMDSPTGMVDSPPLDLKFHGGGER